MASINITCVPVSCKRYPEFYTARDFYSKFDGNFFLISKLRTPFTT